MTVIGNISHNCCDNCACSLERPLQSSMQQLNLDDMDDQVPVHMHVVSQVKRDELWQHVSTFRHSVIQSVCQQCEGKPRYVGMEHCLWSSI